MAERIGVTRNWYQRDHYDIAMSKKKLALAAGARQISLRQLACMVWLRRRGHAMGEPETAEARYRGQRAAAAPGHGAGRGGHLEPHPTTADVSSASTRTVPSASETLQP